MRNKLISITSSPADKARACREFKEKVIIGFNIGIDERGQFSGGIMSINVPKPAAWAFEYERKWHCFMENERPSCATEDCRIITRDMYSAVTGETRETAEHYVCGVKNGR
tara:strand:- start:3580 stop:3909 length:330 start_codon:yes stop_codon:yes gene_type:complete